MAGLIYVYARQRRLITLVHEDFSAPGQVRAKLAIALAVCALALLFVVTHLHALIALLAE
ncbi:Inner membrane protein yidG [Cronobacter sakazakii]|nr:Inner membrane protein yidG [Cronobacter sakazakii]